MSKVEVTLAPPNSIIFVADPSQDYEVAENTGSALVTSTKSSIGIGTLAEMDGETTIKLGTAFATPDGILVFDGPLGTPGRRVSVIDSGASEILSVQVPHIRTHVRVWANDLKEPDSILIEVR